MIVNLQKVATLSMHCISRGIMGSGGRPIDRKSKKIQSETAVKQNAEIVPERLQRVSKAPQWVDLGSPWGTSANLRQSRRWVSISTHRHRIRLIFEQAMAFSSARFLSFRWTAFDMLFSGTFVGVHTQCSSSFRK